MISNGIFGAEGESSFSGRPFHRGGLDDRRLFFRRKIRRHIERHLAGRDIFRAAGDERLEADALHALARLVAEPEMPERASQHALFAKGCLPQHRLVSANLSEIVQDARSFFALGTTTTGQVAPFKTPSVTLPTSR